MTRRPFVILLSLLVLAVAPVSHAAPSQKAEIISSSDKVVSQPSLEVAKQKLQLVKMLLTKSPALERAAHSDDATIKQQVVTVHTLYTNANDALSAGNTARADELLDEALYLIEDISRLAPDPQQAAAEQKIRYTNLLDSVRSIQVTYQDLRRRVSPKDAGSPPVTADLDRVRKLVEQAETLARDGRHREAGDLLKTAHSTIVSALNKLLASTTLTYDSKFESPAEEFEYEIARYRSYEELVPIAYTELKPGEDSIKLSERYVRESRAARDIAKQQAASGDHTSAINTLQGAIKRLQTALQTLGVVVSE